MSNIQAVFDRLAGLAKEQELRKQEATQSKYQVKQRQIDRAIKNQEPTNEPKELYLGFRNQH